MFVMTSPGRIFCFFNMQRDLRSCITQEHKKSMNMLNKDNEVTRSKRNMQRDLLSCTIPEYKSIYMLNKDN